MDRHSDHRTYGSVNDWKLIGSGDWDDTHDRDRRARDGAEEPSRPLLDRLTQAGGGRWVPTSPTGVRRDG